ncbi:MAG TPA: helix-turn-helix domain-containing protein, partial [Candidatus Caccousia avistercoris]|nr:helix-turn-helix domain-containing protein [Candidatus Caccousia avistercoris]
GNTTAQVFWLKNRRPDRWRDKPAPAEAEEDDGLFQALAEAVEREV